MLTADSHVHSEWSWDTGGPRSEAAGTMTGTCERAVRIGVPAVIFTEHFDFDDAWRAGAEDFPAAARGHINEKGYLVPPPLDVEGYFDAIAKCRQLFPQLSILSGVEFGQPHLFEDQARQLVDLDRFDRINGSLHTLPIGPDRAEPVTLYRLWPPDDVVWAYLEEVPTMVAGSAVFEVFTHIDYAVRYWPAEQAGRPFDPRRFEEGFRSAMRAIADSGRALEMNTGRLRSWIPQWWRKKAAGPSPSAATPTYRKLLPTVSPKPSSCSSSWASALAPVPTRSGRVGSSHPRPHLREAPTRNRDVPPVDHLRAPGKDVTVNDEVLMRPAAGVVLRNAAGRVLMLRRATEDTWGIPGGGLEAGESWVDAAVRECREETGWLARVDGLLGIYSDPNTQVHRYPSGTLAHFVGVVFIATAIENVGIRDEEASELRWVSTDDLPTPLFAPDVPVLRDYFDDTVSRPIVN